MHVTQSGKMLLEGLHKRWTMYRNLLVPPHIRAVFEQSIDEGESTWNENVGQLKDDENLCWSTVTLT